MERKVNIKDQLKNWDERIKKKDKKHSEKEKNMTKWDNE